MMPNNRKIISLIYFSFFSIFISTFLVHAKTSDNGNESSGYIDKILAADPNTISKEQFYQYETDILHGFSGSGGYFLEEPEIQWLKKTEEAFKARKMKLSDTHNRHFVFADSYLNHGLYDKALEEFKNIKDQEGIELAEWFIGNKGVLNGAIKIKEYPGMIRSSATQKAKAEDKQYLFTAYFKGPIYRYDKINKRHAIIYAPADKYDWCNALLFDGEKLIIKLWDNTGTFIFDNKKQEISQLSESFAIDKEQVAVFFGPDFYDLEDVIIENLKLSPDRTKIAFIIYDKSKEVFSNLVIAHIDGSDKKLLVKEGVSNFTWFNDSEIIYKVRGEKNKFNVVNIDGKIRESNVKVDFSEDIEISKVTKKRLDEFVESKYKDHYGILGGFAQYGVRNYVISPDKKKIAFLVTGEDGHKEFYPAWYLCNDKGESITLIDETQTDMSNNIVWLSDNEIEYIKDARLWEAIVK